MISEQAKVTYIEDQETEICIPDLPVPPEGKAWRRISNGRIYPGEIYLGKLFFLNGKRLESPIQEKPEDFELIPYSDTAGSEAQSGTDEFVRYL